MPTVNPTKNSTTMERSESPQMLEEGLQVWPAPLATR